MKKCGKCKRTLTEEFCEYCTSKYEGINSQQYQAQINGRGKLILMFVGIGVILVPIILISLFSSPPPKKELKDLTNKEYNEFMKWDQEQKQKEWENKKAFQ
ncbi:hypothetical protein [Aneurinibacillus tyrosinisolvens]|uniref:hypothetical protein n=1 Tax=Aneurinibacillus tyrosinisolvens TaxID=1443435 RepID=UPI00063FB647|nr:hypothetical protein [Aneurinibacillus tyrosinisolvens]